MACRRVALPLLLLAALGGPAWAGDYTESGTCTDASGNPHPCGSLRQPATTPSTTGPSAEESREEQERRAASDLNRRGMEARKAGNYAEAIRLYREALQLTPDSAVIRQNLANAEEWQRQAETAARIRSGAADLSRKLSATPRPGPGAGLDLLPTGTPAPALALMEPSGFPEGPASYEVSGSATLSRGGKPVPAGQPLQPGDRIRTGPDGRVRIRHPDGSKLEIGPGSDYRYDPDRAKLEQGLLHSLHEEALEILGAHRRRGTLSVSNAVAATRGTEYAVRAERGGACTILLLDGELSIRHPSRKSEIVLQGRQLLRFDATKILEGPTALDAAELDPWWGL